MKYRTKDVVEGGGGEGNEWTMIATAGLRLLAAYLPHVSHAVCASDRNIRAIAELSSPVHMSIVQLANCKGLLRDRVHTVELLLPTHIVRFMYNSDHQAYVECVVDVRDVRMVEHVLWWLQVAAVRSLRLEGAECLSAVGLQQVLSALLRECPLAVSWKALPEVLEELTCNGSSAYHAVMLKNVGVLQRCRFLRKLQMDWCWLLKSVDGLEHLPALETLRIPGTRVSVCRAVGECSRLQCLDMSYSEECVSLAGLESLTSLVNLELAYTPVEDLRPLKGNEQMETLSLNHCTQLRSLIGLDGMLSLKSLDLSSTAVNLLLPLQACQRLQHLKLAGCTELRALKGLENCSDLEELELQGSSVESLVPLRECRQIQKLNLRACRQLRTLVGLENAADLEELILLDSGIQSLVPLQEGRRLKKLKLAYCEQLLALVSSLPVTSEEEKEEERRQGKLGTTR